MKNTLRASFFAALTLSTSVAFASFDQCKQFFPGGVTPLVSTKAPGKQRDLCMSGFAALHSGQSKTSVFVVERLNREHLMKARAEKRTDNFYEEARLPSGERAQLGDYKARDLNDNRYDRGHLAPAADMADGDSMAQSFSLANMVPQAPRMNRKPWADVENSTRKYVMRAQGDVFVFTGPVYSGQVEGLGKGQVWIPHYMFKLVYDATTNRAWAYWMDNRDDAAISRPISYKELVVRTGTQFLPGRAPVDESAD